jgi:endonuclease/exonuclease/phosphatase family metal-dependent hydrolase
MDQTKRRLRLATFNIKHGAPAESDWGDAEAVAEACAALEADVLALQEVDQGLPRSGLADLAAAAARAAGMSFVFAPAMPIRDGRYGNALLVRGEIERHTVLSLKRRRWLLPRRTEPRIAILATVRAGGHRLSVAATHLETSRWVSKQQLPQALAGLQTMPEPWVLLGDLNRSADQVHSEPLLGSMEVVTVPATFPSWGPTLRIDHIAIRGLALRADTVDAVHFPRVSDHLALVADVEVL